jgi:FkbM family methyltransferase
LPFGSTIEVDLNERIERQMYYFGWYQRHQSQFLRANLRKGDVFVDVGAHIGFYTLLGASAVGAAGVVHAFEPNPVTFERLGENIRMNGYYHVKAWPFAVTNKLGRSALHLTTTTGELGWSSMFGDGIEDVPVETLTLDDCIRRCGLQHVDVVKIDAEGAELRIIEGMSEILRSMPPRLIMVELHGPALGWAGATPAEVVQSLESFGYSCYQLNYKDLVRYETSDSRDIVEDVFFVHNPKSVSSPPR